MPGKILLFPTRYRPGQPPAPPEHRRRAWLRGRPHPLDRVEVALLRLDWAMRARAMRAHPHS